MSITTVTFAKAVRIEDIDFLQGPIKFDSGASVIVHADQEGRAQIKITSEDVFNMPDLQQLARLVSTYSPRSEFEIVQDGVTKIRSGAFEPA